MKYRSSESWKQSVSRFVASRRTKESQKRAAREARQREEFFTRYGQNALQKLDVRSQIVLTKCLGLDGNSPETLEQISQRLCCSPQNVSLIKQRSLALLDAMKTDKRPE